MPPQRSQRVASRHGSSDKPAKLPRGQRGYRKHRSGFLNVEPIGSEVEIGLKNTRDSPLLRLPAEIRNRIWTFALGESVVKMPSKGIKSDKHHKVLACPSLLRVCRQVYTETALIACSSVTLCFRTMSHILRYLRSKNLRHIHGIHFEAGPNEMSMIRPPVCDRVFRSGKIQYLQKVKITLSLYGLDASQEVADVARVRDLVKTCLPDKEVEVNKGTFWDHIAYWESL